MAEHLLSTQASVTGSECVNLITLPIFLLINILVYFVIQEFVQVIMLIKLFW